MSQRGECFFGRHTFIDFLTKKCIERRLLQDREVDKRVRAGAIGAKPDHLGHALEAIEQTPCLGQQVIFSICVASWKSAADGTEDIDCRPPAPLADPAIQNEVSVEDAAHSVGDRLIVIVAID